MSANVDTMFYVSENPWYGLSMEVQEAPSPANALIYVGFDWQVTQEDVYIKDPLLAPWEKRCFGILELAKRKGWSCA